MNQKEWYAKLEEWAFDDARLRRLPLALLPTLAEHLANHEAAQQSVQADKCPYCRLVNIPLRPKDTAYGVCPNCGTRR